MPGCFNSFNKGCGCTLGIIAGLVIAAVLITIAGNCLALF